MSNLVRERERVREKRRVENGKSDWVMLGTGGVALLALTALIFFSFFEGWSVLTHHGSHHDIEHMGMDASKLEDPNIGEVFSEMRGIGAAAADYSASGPLESCVKDVMKTIFAWLQMGGARDHNAEHHYMLASTSHDEAWTGGASETDLPGDLEGNEGNHKPIGESDRIQMDIGRQSAAAEEKRESQRKAAAAAALSVTSHETKQSGAPGESTALPADTHSTEQPVIGEEKREDEGDATQPSEQKAFGENEGRSSSDAGEEAGRRDDGNGTGTTSNTTVEAKSRSVNIRKVTF